MDKNSIGILQKQYTLVKQKGPGVELEVRFYSGAITAKQFDRLLLFLSKYDLISEERSTVESKSPNNTTSVRKITSDKGVIVQKKESFYREKYDNITVSVARETPYKYTGKYEHTRSRTRKSFKYDDNWVIDVTEVTSTHGNEITQSYEVELEFAGTKAADIIGINEPISIITKELLGTHLAYKSIDEENLKKYLDKHFGQFKYSVLVQARNLKREDLVMSGIVDNRYASYYVTYKADGLRKLLVVYDGKVWLTYFPDEYNLIGKDIQGLYVFDGELVDDIFYIFDTLVSGKNVEKKDYETRAEFAKKFSKEYSKIGDISIKTKAYYKLTQNNFFDTMGTMLASRHDLPYREDGFMFIPSSQYNSHNEKVPLADRLLTRRPDVCKWKEAANMTIDLKVMRVAGQYGLYAWDPIQRKNVLFNPEGLVFDVNELINAEKSGTILEFAMIDGVFSPIKERPDKKYPNGVAIAFDNWNNIFDPITPDELSGVSVDRWISRTLSSVKSRINSTGMEKLDSSILSQNHRIGSAFTFLFTSGDAVDELLDTQAPFSIQHGEFIFGDFKSSHIVYSRFFKDLVYNGYELKEFHFVDHVLLPNDARAFCSAICYGWVEKVTDKKIEIVEEDVKISKVSSSIVESKEIDIYDLKDRLAWLPVDHVDSKGKIRKRAANGDDAIEPLLDTEYYRISCIGDGSCLLHAVLKAVYPPYQESKSAEKRIDMANDFRIDMREKLSKYYKSIQQGGYVALAKQQKLDPSLIQVLDVDYSEGGMRALYNSASDLGDESYGYIADLLDIDLYIYKGTSKSIQLVTETRSNRTSKSKRNFVMILGNGSHYETIAIMDGPYLQTIFDNDAVLM
jgi:hypothetical protein